VPIDRATFDYDPADPRLDERITRQQAAALTGKDPSTIKDWIKKHGIEEEVLPGDGRRTRVMRLGALVSRGLYQLPELPPAGQPAETLQELSDRRATERDNDLLRRQLAGALAERDAARLILADKSAENARLAGWLDSLIKDVA
jgi:hypothetical protein